MMRFMTFNPDHEGVERVGRQSETPNEAGEGEASEIRDSDAR